MAALSTITGGSLLGVPKLTTIESVGGILCHICRLTFSNKKEYDAHYLNHCNDKAKITYTCVVCSKNYSGYPTFRNHCYVQHILKDKFKCSHCAKCFPKISFLNEHVDAVHNFRCGRKTCNKKFTTKTELHLHQIMHKNEIHKPPYSCRTCTKPILNPDDCEAHINSHFTLTYFCPVCNVEIKKENAAKHLTEHFGDVPEKNLHENNVPNPKENLQDNKNQDVIPDDSSITMIGGIVCCHCNILFKDKAEIDMHFKAMHRDKDIVYSCNVCKKQFDKYAVFGTHCYTHCSRTRFECDKCTKSFPRLSVLVDHMETYHAQLGGAKKPFPCRLCERRFHSEKKRQEHLRAKHGAWEWVCTEPGCDSSFETHKDLLLHRKRHLAALFNWCRTCGMQFDTLASCERHLDIHRKQLFTCPVCSKTSNEKYYLMKHVPKHFESVFHMCKICGKVYSEKRRLIQHTKTHANVKSYLCSYCGKGFTKSSHMEQHINVHTGIKPYKCVACPKTFASYPNWNKHLKRMHGVDAKTLKRPQKTQAQEQNHPKSDPKDTHDPTDSHVKLTLDYSDLNEFDDSSDSDSDSTIADEVNAIESFLDKSFENDGDGAAKSNQMNGTMEKQRVAIEMPCPELKEMLPMCDTPMLELELLDVGISPEPPQQAVQVAASPMEYGPDFVSHLDPTLMPAPGEFIDLDDHLLPHIDPLLTIKCDPPSKNDLTGLISNQALYLYSQEADITNEVSKPNLGWGSSSIEVYSCFNSDMIPFYRSSVM